MKTMVKKFVVRPILILLIVLSITVTTVAIVFSIYVEKYIEKSIHYVSNDVISITNNEIALNYFQLCL